MELKREHLKDFIPGDTDTTRRIVNAEKVFRQYDFETPEAGDHFFEYFGIGNAINMFHQPYERFLDYERLLKAIRKIDPLKYQIIHKGTPFYFLSWLAFQLKSHEKGVFYMDAAISEDIRKTVYAHKKKNATETRSDDVLSSVLLSTWITNSSGKFFTLQKGPFPMITEITKHLEGLIQKQLDRFNTETGSSLTKNDFITRFILKLAENPKSRSISTALYSFIMEFEEIETLILLRSKEGGSLEPITTYLFKGGLIFESLLKYKYPIQSAGNAVKTLGDLRNVPAFVSNYGISSINTSATDLTSIVHGISSGNSIQSSFDTTARIRNTTGHNLAWDDIFNAPENFKKIYEQIINACLHIFLIDF